MMTSQITYSSQTAFARALLQVQSTLVLTSSCSRLLAPLTARVARSVRAHGSFASTAGSTLANHTLQKLLTDSQTKPMTYEQPLATLLVQPTVLILNLIDFIIIGINRNIHDIQFTIIH